MERRLYKAIVEVRHRNLQKRINRNHPDIPKEVASNGNDWTPCAVCWEETQLIIKELNKG